MRRIQHTTYRMTNAYTIHSAQHYRGRGRSEGWGERGGKVRDGGREKREGRGKGRGGRGGGVGGGGGRGREGGGAGEGSEGVSNMERGEGR